MNELEQNYRKKSVTLNGLKKMFYKNKEYFKKLLHEQPIGQQARLFLQGFSSAANHYKKLQEY